MNKKKILFFFPFFGLSGSEIILLEFIKTLDRSRFESHIYSFKKGELINYLPEEIPYHLPYKLSGKIFDWIVRKSISKRNDNYLVHQLKTLQKKHKFDLWYANTIAVNLAVYDIAKSLEVKIAAHIHELPFVFSENPSNNLRKLRKYSDAIICCSRTVLKMFNKIEVRNCYLLYNFFQPRFYISDIKNKYKTEFGLSDNDFIWLISARTSFSKGLHYLPELLEALAERKIKILWVGEVIDNALYDYIKELIDIHFKDRVVFLGSQSENYYRYFQVADGFLNLSIQESFSLVCLEANYFGLPIVSFDFGATQEILSHLPIDSKIIPLGDISALAIAMRQVMDKSAKEIKQVRQSNEKIPPVFSKETAKTNFQSLLETIISRPPNS